MSVMTFDEEIPNLYQDLDKEEQILFPLCAGKMLDHIDRYISELNKKHESYGKLLSFRWVIEKNLRLMDN